METLLQLRQPSVACRSHSPSSVHERACARNTSAWKPEEHSCLMIPLGRAGAEAAVMSGALSARGEHDDDEDEGALSTGSVGAVGGG